MKYDILKYPNPILKEVSKLVKIDEIDNNFRAMINELFELMYYSRGGGLAAIQVGIKKRFFLMDGSENKDQKIVVINPEIIESRGEIVEEEGCLSFPGVYVKIKRAEWVKIKAINEKGKAFELASDGYLGRCIQHELDHLNGIIFFDRLSNLKRKMVEKKYKNMLKESDN
ncbi:MAG: peptide deformylase [Francisellaceae bacterium]|jgi:peptide deformylase